MKPTYIILIVIAGLIAVAAIATQNQPSNTSQPTAETQTDTQFLMGPETVVDGLQVPWAVAFLPGGDMLITQRPGSLLRVAQNRETIPISGVHSTSEGGLMGLALHPQFASNNLIYVYLTARENGSVINRVERYKLDGSTVSDRRVIIDKIPGASIHDGGRIAFGPDGLLYITAGDANQPNLAQDKGSLAGKILRLTDDGGIPADNPFDNPVYTFGHRNPQGLAWDDRGNLWATEHGPSGSESGYDELNLIRNGQNYGWPQFRGDAGGNGTVPPVRHSGASDTWAPSGLAFHDGWLYFGGLRGEAVYAYKVEGERTTDTQTLFKGQFGRIREVVSGPEGLLYFATSNTDGRGRVRSGDDRLMKVRVQ